MQVNELITRLGFRADYKELLKFDFSIKSILKTNAMLVAGVGAGVAAMFGLAKSAANVGEELYNASQRTGIAVDNLQVLRAAAKIANVDIGELDMSLTLLSKNFVKAKGGSKEAAKAFQGFDIKNIKTTDELFKKVADRFATMPDGFKKTALATQIFGRAGARLIPFLNEGSAGIAKMRKELEPYGLFTDKSTKASDDFNDSIELLELKIGMLKNSIGMKLIPIFQPLITKFGKWLDLNVVWLRSGIIKFFEKFISVLRFLKEIARSLVADFEMLSDAITTTGTSFKTLAKIGAAIGLGLMLAFAPTTLAILAVEAAIGVTLLAFDDFLGWMQGRQSVIEEFLGPFDLFIETLKNFPGTLKSVVLDFIPLYDILNKISLVMKTITDFPTTFRSVLGEKFAAPNASVDLAKQFNSQPTMFSAAQNQAAQLFQKTPNGNTPQGQRNDIVINQKIEINVASAADAKDIANETRAAMKNEMDKTTRDITRALSRGTV